MFGALGSEDAVARFSRFLLDVRQRLSITCRDKDLLFCRPAVTSENASPEASSPPLGLLGIGAFWIFASCMAALAGTLLIWPGTRLDRLWALNQPAHLALAPIGNLLGPVFYLFSLILMVGAVGWFKQRRWAWRLSVVILSIQIIGDLVNLIRGDVLRGSLGVVVASALLFYIWRSKLRLGFR